MIGNIIEYLSIEMVRISWCHVSSSHRLFGLLHLKQVVRLAKLLALQWLHIQSPGSLSKDSPFSFGSPHFSQFLAPVLRFSCLHFAHRQFRHVEYLGIMSSPISKNFSFKVLKVNNKISFEYYILEMHIPDEIAT